MFCSKCGSSNPDNSNVCGNCGNRFNNAGNANNVNSVASAGGYQQPCNKKEFLASHASENAKTASKITLILSLILVVVMVASYFVTMNTSFEKIPFVSFILGDEADLDADMDSIEDIVQDVEEYIVEEEDDLDDEILELLQDFIDVTEELPESFSINNIKSFLGFVEDLDSYDLPGEVVFLDDITEYSEDLTEDIDTFLNIASGVVLFSMLFALLFSALGGFLRIKGLVITGLIFSILHTLLFCGILFLIIVVVLHIALAIFISKINAEYKAYNNMR